MGLGGIELVQSSGPGFWGLYRYRLGFFGSFWRLNFREQGKALSKWGCAILRADNRYGTRPETLPPQKPSPQTHTAPPFRLGEPYVYPEAQKLKLETIIEASSL